MVVEITSGGIQAICAVLILLSGVVVFVVNAIVARQIRGLNGTYIYSAGSRLTGHEIEGQFRTLESTLADLPCKTHPGHACPYHRVVAEDGRAD